jgi:UDP-N-acetylglucosamine--N-acetylmuramyl-(pentapeptide) pyrophosphoryl-undecaprenol N-acetylglucosamine transferase
MFQNTKAPVKKIVIAAGGTGGHLFPAQALAQELLSDNVCQDDILFLAGQLSDNRYFDRSLYSFAEIACSPLFAKNPVKLFKGIGNLLKGFRQSIALLKKHQAEVVVGFGSYHCVATLLAAKWLKIPIVLHEANFYPGKANRLLAPLASKIALNIPTSAKFFKGKTVAVGMPLRPGFKLEANSKETAIDYYTLDKQNQILLICGGSQGAQTINQVISESLPFIRSLSFQVIHFTGHSETTQKMGKLYKEHGIPAVVKDFENQMQMAWRAADFFIGRSGASTIAEAREFEVPGLLIPYPFAGGHQEFNADYFVKMGFGRKLLQTELTSVKVNKELNILIGEQAYRQALKKEKQQGNRMTLKELVLYARS